MGTEALAGLEDVAWDQLEDAYGAAVDVPDLLRAIAAGERHAIGTLHGHVFHQGASYYPSTAPTVPFLVRLACAPSTPHREDVIGFLSEMTAGHQGYSELGWEPYAFRSTPASLGYPEADATVDAIRTHAAALEALLDDDAPHVRAATAHLLAGLGGGDPARLRRSDPDPMAQGSMLLARARLGDAFEPDDAFDDAGVRACAAIARAWVGELRPDALEEAALLPASACWDGFPWCMSFASLAAGPLAHAVPVERVVALVEARLARGDRLSPPPVPTRRGLEPEPYVPPVVSPEDGALRALVGVVARRAFERFGDRRADLILRDELDDLQRRILRWTVDYDVPVPVAGIPWFRAASMRRFLEGEGPLDRMHAFEGVTRPLWRWLHEVNDDASPVLADILGAHEPPALLALARDLFEQPYSATGFAPCLKWKHWGPLEDALAAQANAIAAELRERARCCDASTPSQQAMFWVRLLSELGPLGDQWDDLLVRAAYDKRARPVLETLPLERRSRIIGRLQNAYTRRTLAELADAAIVTEATLETFLSDAWWPDRHSTRGILTSLGEPALDSMRDALTRAEGVRAELLQEAIDELSGTLWFALKLGVVGERLHLELVHPDGRSLGSFEAPVEAKPGDLADLVAALERHEVRELALAEHSGDAPSSTQTYRLMRTLQWKGMRAIQGFRSSMRRG